MAAIEQEGLAPTELFDEATSAVNGGANIPLVGAPPGKGFRSYLTLVIVSFTAATTTATSLSLSDGTTRIVVQIPTGSTILVLQFDRPLKSQDNADWSAVTGPAGTAVQTTISVGGFIRPSAS